MSDVWRAKGRNGGCLSPCAASPLFILSCPGMLFMLCYASNNAVTLKLRTDYPGYNRLIQVHRMSDCRLFHAVQKIHGKAPARPTVRKIVDVILHLARPHLQTFQPFLPALPRGLLAFRVEPADQLRPGISLAIIQNRAVRVELRQAERPIKTRRDLPDLVLLCKVIFQLLVIHFSPSLFWLFGFPSV